MFVGYYTGRKTGHQLALGQNTNLELDESVVGTEGSGELGVRRRQGALCRRWLGHPAQQRTAPPVRRDGRQLTVRARPGAQRGCVRPDGMADAPAPQSSCSPAAATSARLHSPRFSPKTSLVYSFTPSRSVRFTYNRAFQVPNFSELFLQDRRRAAGQSERVEYRVRGLQGGVRLRSDARARRRQRGAGRRDRQLMGDRLYRDDWHARLLHARLLSQRLQQLHHRLVLQLGTALGRVNPAFGPWQAPVGLPAAVADAIRANVPLLSNASDGSNVLAAVSYANFGQVRSQGVDVGATYAPAPSWTLSCNYSWFDFAIDQQLPGFSLLLLPNAPTHKWGSGSGLRASAAGRDREPAAGGHVQMGGRALSG